MPSAYGRRQFISGSAYEDYGEQEGDEYNDEYNAEDAQGGGGGVNAHENDFMGPAYSNKNSKVVLGNKRANNNMRPQQTITKAEMTRRKIQSQKDKSKEGKMSNMPVQNTMPKRNQKQPLPKNDLFWKSVDQKITDAIMFQKISETPTPVYLYTGKQDLDMSYALRMLQNKIKSHYFLENYDYAYKVPLDEEHFRTEESGKIHFHVHKMESVGGNRFDDTNPHTYHLELSVDVKEVEMKPMENKAQTPSNTTVGKTASQIKGSMGSRQPKKFYTLTLTLQKSKVGHTKGSSSS